jgi:CRISPR/Cas system Type II protein with McrA/HNH and RuvC-like nuclease domain
MHRNSGTRHKYTHEEIDYFACYNLQSNILFLLPIEVVEGQTKCYLTGRAINIENSEEYELDHIIPVSKGGSCELTNMGIACVAANQAKKDLSVEEFIQLCKEVCENFGYEVKKK